MGVHLRPHDLSFSFFQISPHEGRSYWEFKWIYLSLNSTLSCIWNFPPRGSQPKQRDSELTSSRSSLPSKLSSYFSRIVFFICAISFASGLPCINEKTSLLSIKGLEEIVGKRDLSDWRFGLIFSPSVYRVFVFVFSSTKLRNTIRHYSCKTTDWDRCYDWHNIDIVALDVEGKSSRIWLGIVSLQNTKIHTQFIHAIQFFSRSVILVKISIYFSKLYTAVGVVGRESHKAVKPLLETL